MENQSDLLGGSDTELTAILDKNKQDWEIVKWQPSIVTRLESILNSNAEKSTGIDLELKRLRKKTQHKISKVSVDRRDRLQCQAMSFMKSLAKDFGCMNINGEELPNQ